MKKIAMTFALAAVAAAAAAAVRNHVPGKLDGTCTTFRPAAAKFSHVLVVNVGGAIPEEDWPLVVGYAASRIPINVWTNSLPESPVSKLVADASPAALKAAVGDDKAVVAVFVERLSSGASALVVPGVFSRVDVKWLESDSPSRATLRDRQAKTVLRGMAWACGAGATIEPMCSLFYGARTLAGMDRTNVTISPMAYFPMVEVLRALGGDEAVNPAPDETE